MGTEMATRPKQGLNTISESHEKSQEISGSQNRLALLALTAEAMQVQLPSPAALKLYLDDLACLTDEQFITGLTRTRREFETFGKFPSVAQIFKMAGVPVGEEREDIEAAAAWDELTKFVSRNVQSSPEGQYCAMSPELLPAASQTAARRTGGWEALKCMTRENEPFKRKDFIEHFKMAKKEPEMGTIKKLEGMVKGLAQLKAMEK